MVETITSLLSEAELSSPPLRPAHIGVMAPWREHVWKLRERMRKESLHDIDVGTVEVRLSSDKFLVRYFTYRQDYQGRESRVVIVSCVRSSRRFLKEDSGKGIGLIFEKKR